MFPVNIAKIPPPEDAVRRQIRLAAAEMAGEFSDSEKTPSSFRTTLYEKSRELLVKLGLSEDYLGWTLVMLGNAVWRPWVERVPAERRFLLLPHCVRDKEVCPAKFSPRELICEGCGKCPLAEWKRKAEAAGMRVMIAEGSPTVVQAIMAEKVDAVLGVACLNSLEKAFDKILLLGMPAMAVPLLTSTCEASETETACVEELIGMPYVPGSRRPPGGGEVPKDDPSASLRRPEVGGYLIFSRQPVSLLRQAGELFVPESFNRLMACVGVSWPVTPKEDQHPRMTESENAALEFLLHGGKHFRPFITLAAYDALTGGGQEDKFPEAVRCVAVAIEIFHKASLVHDDIEDDDAFRYGRPTMHTLYGMPAAINMGDYLIGLGYRLLAAQASQLGGEVTAEIVTDFSKAHMRLCGGQGAELAFQRAGCEGLTAKDVLRIYALKTAPAFEVALMAGIRLAGLSPAEFSEKIARFCRHLGVGFQILNDLDDWKETATNKITAGGDAVKKRPTLLHALATQGASSADREVLAGENRREIFAVYEKLRIFEQARAIFEKCREKSLGVAEEISHPGLAELLRYFVETILCG